MAGPLDRPIYTPQAPAAGDPTTWAYREFRQIAQVFSKLAGLHLDVVNAAPTKPRAGDVAYADGTNWNPGSGEGLYVYKSTGWTFIV